MTPFSEVIPFIYDELEKSELFEDNYLDTELKLAKLSRMILVSATVDFSSCHKLKGNVAYKEKRINKVINSDVSQVVIDVSDFDKDLLNEMILYINDEEIIQFNFDVKETENETINCYINYEFKEKDNVEIIFLNEGYFNVDLSIDEKYIIALGSTYHYMEQKIKDEQKWVKRLGDKDYSVTRGSIDNYRILCETIKKNLVIYINKYNERNASVDDFM